MSLNEVYLGASVASNVTKVYKGVDLVFERGGGLISCLANHSWQSLFVEEDSEYNDSTGVWNDNGIANKDTVLVAGAAPSVVENWRNGRRAIEFNGANSLRIAESADNYSTFNVLQSIFLVGEYTDTGFQKFLEAGIFEIDNISTGLPVNYNGVANPQPFIVRKDYANDVFALGIFAYGDKVLNYNEGDFILNLSFDSQSLSRDVFMGDSDLNGRVAMFGITEAEQPPACFKEIVKKLNSHYAFDFSSDNQFDFIGDSLTAGVTIPDKTDFWTYNLIIDLQAVHSETFRYLDTSVSGIRLTNYDPQPFDDNLAFINDTAINNRVLFIWLGSNDFAPFGFPAVDAAEMLTNMVAFIVDRLRSGFKKIAVGTVIDRIEFQNDPALGTEVDTYNANIKAYDFSTLETDYGASIEIVALDDQPELQDATNLTYFNADEIHITAAGAAIVKTQMQLAYEALRVENLPQDTTAPVIELAETPNNNSYVDLTFSKGGFGDALAYTVLDINNFSVTDFIPGGATSASITSVDAIDTADLVGNDKRIRINLSYTGTISGTESFTITTTSFHDVFGNLMTAKSPVISLAGLHPDLQAVLDQATLAGETIPSSGNIDNLDVLIKELDSLGAWSDIDRMLCYCTDGDQDFNLRQFKNPTVSAINNGADYVAGVEFDGTTTATNYVDTSVDLSTLDNYSLLDASIIYYIRQNGVNQTEFGVDDVSYSTRLLPNRTAVSVAILNSSDFFPFPVTRLSSVGTHHFNFRDIGGGDSEEEIFSNGVLYENATVTPQGVPSGQTMYEFARNNNGTRDLSGFNAHSLVIIGGDLSSYAAGIHSAIDTFMTAQGINV